MNNLRWTRKRLAAIGLLILLVIAGIAWAAWALRPVDYLASGGQTKTFEIDCSFDRFRQIMVRKNATAAIIAQSGMTLLDEKVEGLQIDARGDDRPLRNALRGRSKANVSSAKEISVRLDDPALQADSLVLRQQADIQPDEFHVVTRSTAPAGNLEDYETTLTARPAGEKTQIDLSVAMKVHVRLPWAFTNRADVGVQQAADRAIADQATSIATFVDQFAGDLLILPELK